MDQGRGWDTRFPIIEAVRLLASSPQYAGLRSLTLEDVGVGDAGAEALASSRTLAELTTLGLAQCDVGLRGLQALLHSPVVSGVRSLRLGGNAGTAAEGEALAAALAGSKHLHQLESLVMDETPVTDRAAALLSGADWPALKRLKLVPYHPQHSDRPTELATMSAVGVEALCGAGVAGSLEWLDLGGQPFGDAGATALARRARLARLRRLDAAQTGITAAGLRDLVAAYAGQLAMLQLSRCPIGDEGAAILAGASWPRMSPEPGAVRWETGLLLNGCGIGDAGATALLNSTTIPTDIPILCLGQGRLSGRVEAALKRKYPTR